MNDLINYLSHSKFILVAYSLIFFISGFIGIIMTIWIGQYKNIKKMDRLFNYDIVNLGVWFNSHRAFAYGMSFLFPNSLAKRVHKSVDLSKIKRNEKIPYMIYAILTLSIIAWAIIGYLIIV